MHLRSHQLPGQTQLDAHSHARNPASSSWRKWCIEMLIALLEHLSSVVSVLDQLQHAGVDCQKLICTFSVMHCNKSSS